MTGSVSASSDRFTDGRSEPPIWSPPDPALAAAGIEGEFVVARVRLLAMGLLLIAPTWSVLHDPRQADLHHRLPGHARRQRSTSFAIWVALRRGRWRPWVGFASSALDVSLVSTALVTFLVVDSPLTALNSNVTFEMYFLATGRDQPALRCADLHRRRGPGAGASTRRSGPGPRCTTTCPIPPLQ